MSPSAQKPAVGFPPTVQPPPPSPAALVPQSLCGGSLGKETEILILMDVPSRDNLAKKTPLKQFYEAHNDGQSLKLHSSCRREYI